MDAFTEELAQIVGKSSNAPFLFVGSGFSRRHLDAETWADLLARFCVCGKPFEFYLSRANNDLTKAAGYLAEDFHPHWFSESSYEVSRSLNLHSMREIADPLKFEIAAYMRSISPLGLKSVKHADEIQLLRKAVIDGVITTNWDLLLEQIFEGYRPFVGQGAILRSSPTGLAEIFKIHGCCSEASSLVLTDRDYNEFNKRNHYLAAKLVTIFVEHPVFFFGYSLTDQNIQEMLTGIVNCLGEDHITLLHDRLIFVTYNKGQKQPKLGNSVFTTAGGTIPISQIQADSFVPIYEVLAGIKRRFPVRILKHLKEQVVQLASTTESTTKVAVIDIADDTDLERIEFVIGVGVTARLGELGYNSIEGPDIAEDFLFERNGFDADKLLRQVFPKMMRSSTNLPVFYYLKKNGIASEAEYAASGLKLDEVINARLTLTRGWNPRVDDLDLNALSKKFEVGKVLRRIPSMDSSKIDKAVLRSFLQQNFDRKLAKKTEFRKALCVLDRIENGW